MSTGEYDLISLGKGRFAKVDPSDADWLNHWRWFYGQGYARRMDQRGGRNRVVYMHRAILDAKADDEVDHINGDGLDNCRCNLRICAHSENMQNQKVRSDSVTGFRGVSVCSYTSRYRVCIWKDGHRFHIGRFDSPEEAARAYDRKACELHGGFAKLNFPAKDLEREEI